ncbi:NAD-binding protein [Rothia nasimurium]|uniref:NAD-binding protein n=1 Tax=Rothia nasimurium TaxID=85336 RepID=UPI001F014D2A|nr:NAD-binding protein [Rothia nasimurium]
MAPHYQGQDAPPHPAAGGGAKPGRGVLEARMTGGGFGGSTIALVREKSGGSIAAAGEALALADSMGLDVEQCHQVLNTGAAHSFMFNDRGTRMVTEDFDNVRSALDIFVKDMGLVTDAARQVAQPVPLASSAEQLYVRGRREGLGRKDDSIVYQLLKDQ